MIVPAKCANCNGLHILGRGAVCDSRCSIDPFSAFDRNPLSPCMRCDLRDECRECCDDRQLWLNCMGKLCRARMDRNHAILIYSLGVLDGEDVA